MPYIVMSACAKMPAKVKARYRRVAVVEIVDPTITPKMISDRARNVRRVVETWERCNVGRAVRSAYTRAVAEANALAADLNARESERASTHFDR